MRSSHSFGSAPKQRRRPATARTPRSARHCAGSCQIHGDRAWRESRRIGGSCGGRLGGFARPAVVGTSDGSVATRPSNAMRRDSGPEYSLCAHHVVREPRRRHDAGRRTRRRRDVAIGLAIRDARFGDRAVAAGARAALDGVGLRARWIRSPALPASIVCDRPAYAARRWTSRRRRRQCWHRRPDARNATSAPAEAAAARWQEQ